MGSRAYKLAQMVVCSRFRRTLVVYWFYKMDKSQHSAPANPPVLYIWEHRDVDEHLISPQSYDSWLILLEAAKVRDHTPLLNIAKQLTDKEIPNIYYHRKYRSLFTMKRDQEGIKRRIAESVTDDDSSTTSSFERRSKRLSTATKVYDPICIFCKEDKYQKHSYSWKANTNCTAKGRPNIKRPRHPKRRWRHPCSHK